MASPFIRPYHPSLLPRTDIAPTNGNPTLPEKTIFRRITRGPMQRPHLHSGDDALKSASEKGVFPCVT